MKEIEILSKGVLHQVKLDDEDYERLAAFRWGIYFKSGKFYVSRLGPRIPNGNRKIFHIHREVMGEIPTGMYVDHINGDPLDNRRCNLRIATKAQNNRNRNIGSANKSGFKGVSYHTKGKKWVAHIGTNHKSKYLGLFTSPQDAAKAYDIAAKKHYGEFARTNFE